MPDPQLPSAEFETIEQTAAAWVLRLDAGLTPAEEAELADWLAADPRHEECLAEHQRGWDRFAPLVASAPAAAAASAAATAAPRASSTGKLLRFVPLTLAAAAAIALGFFFLRDRSPAPLAQAAGRPAILPLCELRTLADGSVVELNRGAAIAVNFTALERRVELQRGEANFKVAKDPSRPFIVSAGGVEVRAVGTAFNVRFGPTAVEVVVTEGRVGVERVAPNALSRPPSPPSATLLGAGEHLVVSLAPAAPPPVAVALTPAALSTRLAWQPKLLDYDDVPLADIVAEFNRCNPVRLVVDDPALRALRLTASFRSDNMDGFVRLIESNYGVRVETRTPTEIVLRRVSAPPKPR